MGGTAVGSTSGRLHIALLGLRSDDGVSASLFVGFSFSYEIESTQTETVFDPVPSRVGSETMCKVRRQEDLLRADFNLRV